MPIIAVLKGIQTIAEIVIPVLGWLKKRKAQRRAARIENVTASVIKAVEHFAEVNKGLNGPDVKTYIQNRAMSDKTEPELNTLVKKYTG